MGLWHGELGNVPYVGRKRVSRMIQKEHDGNLQENLGYRAGVLCVDWVVVDIPLAAMGEGRDNVVRLE